MRMFQNLRIFRTLLRQLLIPWGMYPHLQVHFLCKSLLIRLRYYQLLLQVHLHLLQHHAAQQGSTKGYPQPAFMAPSPQWKAHLTGPGSQIVPVSTDLMLANCMTKALTPDQHASACRLLTVAKGKREL
jgi:hypothetical protein